MRNRAVIFQRWESGVFTINLAFLLKTQYLRRKEILIFFPFIEAIH